MEAMAYRQTAGEAHKEVVEVACNLTLPCSEQGGPVAVQDRITALAQEHNIAFLHAYTTNPTPAALQQILDSGHLGSPGEFVWKVPPGHDPFR